jgi:hypothetical protein
MQSTEQTLTAHIAEAARRAFSAYLPSSPLTGLGRAGELAAQHPAFSSETDKTYRGA